MFGMMNNPSQSYARVGLESEIATADPHHLILMLFDGAIAAISVARIHMADNNVAQKGAAISKAIDLITNGLSASLDKDAGGELADRLDALYEYMTHRLLFANLKNNQAALTEVSGLLSDLREAWFQIAPGKQQSAA